MSQKEPDLIKFTIEKRPDYFNSIQISKDYKVLGKRMRRHMVLHDGEIDILKTFLITPGCRFMTSAENEQDKEDICFTCGGKVEQTDTISMLEGKLFHSKCRPDLNEIKR